MNSAAAYQLSVESEQKTVKNKITESCLAGKLHCFVYELKEENIAYLIKEGFTVEDLTEKEDPENTYYKISWGKK